MMCLYFFYNHVYKWLLKSSVSLSDSGCIQVGGRWFVVFCFVCFFKLGNGKGRVGFFPVHMFCHSLTDVECY